MKYCTDCGVQHEAEAKFCKECGFNFTVGTPQVTVKPKKLKKNTLLTVFSLVQIFMFFFLPYYSVRVIQSGNVRWFSGFGTIHAPDASSGPATLAFIVPFVILAAIFAKRIIPALADKTPFVLAGFSAVGMIANVVMMNTVNRIEFPRGREVNAGPVFFITMLLYIIIIVISVREVMPYLKKIWENSRDGGKKA